MYDPTFSFMHADHDGKIRMDCSSQYAMASLINLKMISMLLWLMIRMQIDMVLLRHQQDY